MENQYYQGDILVISVKEIPKNAQMVEPTNGKLILAEGEATGHHHAVNAQHAHMYLLGTIMYLRVLHECHLRHQEHGEIMLPEGDYQIVRQREHTPWGERRVAD